MMKKIVVTGAFGHLGINLVLSLNAQGIIPRALVHNKTLDIIKVDPIKGDVNDLESLKKCFAGAEIVYHLASKISLFEKDDAALRRVNVDGTRNVIDACLHNKVKRLVYISSIRAFNTELSDETLTETRSLVETHQGFSYDRSKADGVRLVENAIQHGLDAVMIFPPGIIGPHDYNLSPMTQFFLDLYHEKLPVLLEGNCHCVDIQDLVAMIISAGEKGRNGERYILGGHRILIRELAKIVHEITGKKIPKIYLPIKLVSTLAPMLRLYARIMNVNESNAMTSKMALNSLSLGEVSSHKAMQDLGYSPRSIRETIETTFAWFAKIGWI